MLETAVEVTNKTKGDEGLNGAQLQTGEATIEGEAMVEAGNTAEGENAVDTRCHYPRRSNRFNLQFTYGIHG